MAILKSIGIVVGITMSVLAFSIILPYIMGIDQADVLFVGGFGLIGIYILYNFIAGSPRNDMSRRTSTAWNRKINGLGIEDFNARHMNNEVDTNVKSLDYIFRYLGLAGVLVIICGYFLGQ